MPQAALRVWALLSLGFGEGPGEELEALVAHHAIDAGGIVLDAGHDDVIVRDLQPGEQVVKGLEVFVGPVVLIAYGALVIGLVDNLMRPMLVGKDTKMPDYVVFFSTLGGIEAFGLNGFVIGPVIAAMFIAVWDIFSVSRRRDDDVIA